LNGQFIAQMENVLDFYNTPPAEAGVVRLSFDERPCQLLADRVEALGTQKGKTKKVDYEYERCGVSNILLAYDMDQGQRYVEARAQRTKADFAHFWAHLALVVFGFAKRIDVVLDNLNTHNYGSFYENLPLDIAEQLRKKIRFIYTPKHGSWLNLAEIEFAALAKQCLDGRRIPSTEELGAEAQIWAEARNNKKIKIYWSFTTAKARGKFQRHYNNLLNN
jgi:DDE superfamily endonuclease